MKDAHTRHWIQVSLSRQKMGKILPLVLKSICLLTFFDTGPYYVVLAGLGLTVSTRQYSDPQKSSMSTSQVPVLRARDNTAGPGSF